MAGEQAILDAMTFEDGQLPPQQSLPSQKKLIEKRDWDCLIVLDACRYDALDAVADDEILPVCSPAHRTPRWLEAVWAKDGWQDVTYCSLNPHTTYTSHKDEYDVDMNEAVDHRDWWNQQGDAVIFPPHSVIDKVEEVEPPAVLHIMQPHTPFIGGVRLGVTDTKEIDTVPDVGPDGQPGEYQWAEEGMIDPIVIRTAYIENLRLAMEPLAALSSPFDRVVVTADHGELLGPDDWGHSTLGKRQLRVVPWWEYQ